jgi:hypothetical protein
MDNWESTPADQLASSIAAAADALRAAASRLDTLAGEAQQLTQGRPGKAMKLTQEAVATVNQVAVEAQMGDILAACGRAIGG